MPAKIKSVKSAAKAGGQIASALKTAALGASGFGPGDKAKILENLNEAQKKAVVFGEGPLLIVAGAGTGKTTVITRRIAHLISRGVKPDEILALTFTDKAAAEMEERADILLPYGYYDLWISTFHSFCERVLKQYALDIGVSNDFDLLDPVRQKILVRKNLDKFDLDYYRPLGNPAKFVNELVKYFGKLKDEEISPEEYLEYAQKVRLDKDNAQFDDEEARRANELAGAYHAYQRILLETNALDFGDLINYTLKLFRTRKRILEFFRAKFKYILVDEFQDTNFAQYELVKLLAAPKNNLNVVGDDDQSIYKFRGASVSNIMQFQKDFPSIEPIALTENYRSAQNILDMAHTFIQQNNPERLEIKLNLSKKLISQLGENGEIEALSTRTASDEADAVIKKILKLAKERGASWKDFAILVRANDHAGIFISKLADNGIPYIFLANKGLYKKPLISDLIAYLRLIVDHHNSANLYKVLNMEVFRINHDDLASLLSHARKKTLSLYEALQACETISGIKKETVEKIRLLLALLSGHAALAAEKSVAEVFVRVVWDLKISARLEEDTLENSSNRELLEQFYRRIEKFGAENGDRSLKAYLDNLDFEADAGEEGKIEFDPSQGPEAVSILTVHSSKGLEFEHVFIVNMVDRRFPSTERGDPIEIPPDLIKEDLPEGDIHLQEERRLFYVAMTRAKRGLYFTYSEDYGGARAKKPSRFLADLGLVKNSPVKSVEVLRKEERIAHNWKTDKILPASFSFTQIQDFERCPMSYKYKHLVRLPLKGNAHLSFGNTIHNTLDTFLSRYKAGFEMTQLDLFDKTFLKKGQVPSEEELQEIYKKNWIDEWYDDKSQKETFRERGKEILKKFYARFAANPAVPKYLEERFNLKLGNYWFNGKIDRADAAPEGLEIFDYKTGEKKKKEDKEGRKQLMIYQWAAQDFLKEKVAGTKYWYLLDDSFSESFLASAEEIAELKNSLLATIEEIRRATALELFKELDSKIKHKCEFEELE